MAGPTGGSGERLHPRRQGGSPAAVVVDDATLTDGDRRAVTRRTGTSHTASLRTIWDRWVNDALDSGMAAG